MLCWLALVSFASVAVADRNEAFLAALKERGYHDTAVVFLDRLVEEENTSAAWKSRAAYERGVLLLEQAATSPDPAEAESLLAAGVEALRAFCDAAHADHPEHDAARGWMAKGFAQRARLALQRFQTAAGDERLTARQQAEQLFNDARAEFVQRIEALTAALEAVNQGNAAPAEAQRRDRLRADLIGARLEAAMIEFEQAELSREDPPRFQEQIERAAESFASLAQDYNKRIVGFEARYFQGRCVEELGKLREALEFYEPFFDERELPLAVSAKPVARAIDCWVAPSVGEARRAVERGEAWLAEMKPTRDSQPAAAVRLALAKAHQVVGMGAESGAARRASREARELLLAAASVAGPHQTEARTLLAQHSPDEADPSPATDRLRSFSAARQAGDEAHQQLLASDALIEMLERQPGDHPRRRQPARSPTTNRGKQTLAGNLTSTGVGVVSSCLDPGHAGR